MSCYNKGSLTQAEKDKLIKDAERRGPLSDAEKARLIDEAERARKASCTTDDLLRKLLYALAVLGGLLLAYYLFNHFMRKSEVHHEVAVTTEPVKVVEHVVAVEKEPAAPVHAEEKK